MANGSQSRGELVKFERHTYEDPFLDMAATRLPKSMRKLQELCQIFAMTHPQISPIIWRLAEYPITSITYTGDEEAQRQHKEMFEKKLGILDRLVEIGLDYHAYGSCFITISFPFLRFYRCLSCSEMIAAKDLKYKYDGREFSGSCPKCKANTKYEPVDQYLKGSNENIRVFRLEPQLVTPKLNKVTGKYYYFYAIPQSLRMSVRSGDRDIIDETPVEYLKAIRFNRRMRIKRVFYFKRPTVSGRDMQWGMPLVLPALKDAYLNQIYKKADEQVALEHSVPLRILFPEPGSQDPLHKLLLGSFRNFMERNVRYWRRDKNAILTSPLPVGVRVIGGDGANYSTIAARTKVIDEIMMAMGVTPGFVRGGENWSSMNISQRVMENSFVNYLRRIDQCLQWVRDEIAKFVQLPECEIAMRPFKKIDDVQMLQLLVNLASQDKVSWNEVLSRLDLDEKKQLEQINETAIDHVNIMVEKLVGQATATSKQAVLNAVAEVDAQSAQQTMQEMLQQTQVDQGTIPQEPGAEQQQGQQQDTGGGGDKKKGEGNGEVVKMDDVVNQYAEEILQMNDKQKRDTLGRMNKQSPQLAQAVVERASELEGENLKAIMQKSKSPEDVAQQISMLPPRTQLQTMNLLRKENPPLFVKVMGHLARLNGGDAGMVQGKGGDTIDMRPMPEKLPPRRQDKVK
jgi:hypothetical protein